MNLARKVFSVYIDGDHVSCFETELEAEKEMISLHEQGFRYAEYEEEDFEPKCDCKNQNIGEEK